MVGHFVFNFNSYSGAAFQALELASQNKKRKSAIFNIGGSKKLGIMNKKGILIIDLPNSYLRRLYYIILFSILLDIRIFHLHGYVLTGLLTGILLRKKIVMKSTLLDEDDFEVIAQRGWIHKKLIKNINCVISISTPLRIKNENYINCNHLKINHRFITNGINQIESNCQKENIFLIVGIVTPRKRTLDAIKFFKRNFAADKSNNLLIIGPLPGQLALAENNIEYYNLCINEINGFESQIKFTGVLNKIELNEIYKRSLAIILFSSKEGMPNCILEAMSYNCVPILSPIGGIAYDMITDQVDGFIIINEEDSLTTEKIIEISKTRAPSKTIEAKFDFKNLIKLHEDNYDLLLKSK